MTHFNKLQPAEIDWQAVPVSKQFGDVYFTSQALAEAEQVFIQPNRLAERFVNAQTFSIGETGFGTGLNFLSTVKLWLDTQSADSSCLHYYVVEKHPLSKADLQRMYQDHALAEWAQVLIEAYPPLIPGWHRLVLFAGRVNLHLFFGDVLSGFNDTDAQIDAWFLDGFAPSKNPAMWQLPVFKRLRQLSRVGTSLATFTAASMVRNGLRQAGFEVKKIPGFGRKREMINAKVVTERSFGHKTPWFSRPSVNELEPASKVVIVGAGLAGAAVAQALAHKGVKVTVLDAGSSAAQGASGNVSGALHPLITADWNRRSQWYWQGFQATLVRVLPWLEQGKITGDLSGLLQLALDKQDQQKMQKTLAHLGLPSEFASWLNAEQAGKKVGGKVSAGGIWFAQGGWLDPRSLVEACLDHPNIDVHFNQHVERIECIKKNDGDHQAWCLHTADKSWPAQNIVLAVGAISTLNKTAELAVRPLKGQLSYLNVDHQAWCLQKPMAHQGYSLPAGAGGAVTGASFEPESLTNEMSVESHQQNLAFAHQAAPSWLSETTGDLNGRVGFRPVSPDHLPMVGGVVDSAWLSQQYLQQPFHLSAFQYPQQRYRTGLYVSNGHGSRGLMSVFLAADILVADLFGKPLPIAPSLYNATHPARFAIRRWRRGQ